MPRGKLIVLEGIDGSGKSTQTDKAKEYFEQHNLKYAYFHFPMYEHNQFSDVIARFLRGEFGKANEVDPLFVANIYAMDRFRFLPELEKALEENDVVLLDRYVFSNIAYQCAKFDNEEDISRMKEWIFEFEFQFLNLPYPDLNIFFDVPNIVAEERLKVKREGDDRNYLQGKTDIHEEDLELQKKVRNNYLRFMSGAINCLVVKCAIELKNEDDSLSYMVLKPEELFDSYKKYFDYILFNEKI
jgi:dTMP kinase